MKKESEVQKEIIDFLKSLNVYHWRQNNLPVPGRKFNGKRGIPDIWVIAGEYMIGIECKGSDGKQSEDQKDFQKNFESKNRIYILAKQGIEDLVNYLDILDPAHSYQVR